MIEVEICVLEPGDVFTCLAFSSLCETDHWYIWDPPNDRSVDQRITHRPFYCESVKDAESFPNRWWGEISVIEGGCDERTLSDIAGTLFYRGVGWAFNQRSFSLSCHTVSPKGRNKIHLKINQINWVSFFLKKMPPIALNTKLPSYFNSFFTLAFHGPWGVGFSSQYHSLISWLHRLFVVDIVKYNYICKYI